MNEQQKLQKSYAAARSNLLLMTILTALNVLAMVAQFGLRNLFSAAIPQIAYAYFAGSGGGQVLGGLIIGALFIGLFLLCYALSKNNTRWMTAALIVYALDTVFLIGWIIFRRDTSSLLDAVFHAWVLAFLISGVKAAAKLGKLPPQASFSAQAEQAVEAERQAAAQAASDSPIGPFDGRGRQVFSETYKSMQIEVYRREPRTILVVDGQVYSEWEGLVELRYALSARVNGVPIVCSAVADGLSGLMRLYADGQLLAEKRRYI